MHRRSNRKVNGTDRMSTRGKRIALRSDADEHIYDAVVDAAAAFVAWHQQGEPGTPGSLYPMTYAALDTRHEEWERRLDALISAVAQLNGATPI